MTYPLGFMPDLAARKIWAALNLLALPLAWYFLTKIFLILMKTNEVNYLNQILTLLFLAQPLTNNATQGNINTILLAFLSLALYFSLTHKKIAAGLFSAIGFSIKLTPGVVFIYYIAYKKWKELFVGILTSFILLVLIPLFYYGFDETINLYLGWKTVLSDTGHFPFYKYTNQSPLVVMTHLQGLEAVNTISKGFYYLVNFFMIYSFYYFYKRKNEIIFMAFTFIFLLTAAPVVWMEYYLFLVFPFLIINEWMITNKLSKTSKVLWYVKLIAVHLLVKFIIGNHYSDLMAYYGRSFLGLILIVIIFYLEDFRSSKKTICS